MKGKWNGTEGEFKRKEEKRGKENKRCELREKKLESSGVGMREEKSQSISKLIIGSHLLSILLPGVTCPDTAVPVLLFTPGLLPPKLVLLE